LGVQTQPSLENTKIIPHRKLEVLPTLNIKAIVSSEIFVNIHQITRRYITEDCNGKAIPLQAWTDPEGSKSLRLPDFKTFGIWRWEGKAVFTPQEIFLVLISVSG